jgi:hypothetical protein
MIEYFLKDENGNPVKRSDITKIHELDKIFLERNNSFEKGNSREFPVNGSCVYIFYRERGCSRVVIPSHEEETKEEFEDKSKYNLEEVKN